jgi:hypothetical protein
VIVKAPAGVWPPAKTKEGRFELPTPEEMVKVQAAQIKELSAEVASLKYGMESVANVAICFAWVIQQNTGAEALTIPRWLVERMRGAQITIGENLDRDVQVKYTEREPYKVQKIGGE